MHATPIDYLKLFRMPNPVAITGRTPSITNSFINAIIPVVNPTSDEVKAALEILGMTEHVDCAYCGDQYTEWDHLRPLVAKKRPTGYISEIHNLVPACGKCNQSKGNKYWRDWMFGPAPLSPFTRGIADAQDRASRLTAYEAWIPPTRLNFEELVGRDVWAAHWKNHERIADLMQEAQVTAAQIRLTVAATYLQIRREPDFVAP
jgi:HNH endonuclease